MATGLNGQVGLRVPKDVMLERNSDKEIALAQHHQPTESIAMVLDLKKTFVTYIHVVIN